MVREGSMEHETCWAWEDGWGFLWVMSRKIGFTMTPNTKMTGLDPVQVLWFLFFHQHLGLGSNPSVA